MALENRPEYPYKLIEIMTIGIHRVFSTLIDYMLNITKK